MKEIISPNEIHSVPQSHRSLVLPLPLHHQLTLRNPHTWCKPICIRLEDLVSNLVIMQAVTDAQVHTTLTINKWGDTIYTNILFGGIHTFVHIYVHTGTYIHIHNTNWSVHNSQWEKKRVLYSSPLSPIHSKGCPEWLYCPQMWSAVWLPLWQSGHSAFSQPI